MKPIYLDYAATTPVDPRVAEEQALEQRTLDHGQRLAPASINRTLGILRHMLNWAVGREYLDRTPFRRGTEVLVNIIDFGMNPKDAADAARMRHFRALRQLRGLFEQERLE